MRPQSATAIVCLGLLSACTSAGVHPVVTAPTAPKGWIATKDDRPADDTVATPLADMWWQSFGDAGLDTVVAQVLANNLDLKIAASRVLQARAELAAEHSAELPSITGSGKAARDRSLNAFGVPIDQTDARADIAVSYDLDLFGRLKAGTDASRSLALASEAARDTVRLGLIVTAVDSYLSLLSLDAKRRIARDTDQTRRDELARILRRTRAGYAADLDLDQAKIELAAASQLVSQIDREIEISERSLNVLLGSNPEPIPRPNELGALHVPQVPASLPSEVMRKRPDIAEAELRMAAANDRLKAARAAFLPRVELTPTGGGIVSTLLSSPASLFSLGGSILAPLFEGGQLRANENLAGAKVEEAALGYQRTVVTAFAEVEKALGGLSHDQDDIILARSREAAANKAFQTAQRRYASGYSSYIDQLDAQRVLLQAQLATVDATAQHFRDLVALYQALGGGWERSADNEGTGAYRRAGAP